jgi:hypothetical protein
VIIAEELGEKGVVWEGEGGVKSIHPIDFSS